MMIGYARVSTDDQRLDLQKDALEKAGVEPGRIYEEHVSGVKTNRPQLEECLRSTDDGLDVSEIAKQYGGGGHRNAAGFRMDSGWEGEAA